MYARVSPIISMIDKRGLTGNWKIHGRRYELSKHVLLDRFSSARTATRRCGCRVESKLISRESTSYLAANNNDAIKAFLGVYVAYWKNKHVDSGRVVVRKFSRGYVYFHIYIYSYTREKYLYARICMICQDAEMTNIVLDYVSNWFTRHLQIAERRLTLCRSGIRSYFPTLNLIVYQRPAVDL